MTTRFACAAVALCCITACAPPSATPETPDASGAGGGTAGAGTSEAGSSGSGLGGGGGGAGSTGGSATGGMAGAAGTGGSAGTGVVANACIGDGAPDVPPTTGILIDFDMSGRSPAEVLEPGWNEWIVAEATSDTKTFGGVTFTISKSGSPGSTLEPNWYKAGVDAPNYARLVGDGADVAAGNSGGAILLSLSGLSAGPHTVLAYHNTPDAATWAPINVDVNGTRQISNLQPTARALTTDAAASSYVTFTATTGKAVTILYSPSTSGSGNQNVFINAIAVDIPNPATQAKGASPDDRDFHVATTGGAATLSWTAAKGAVSHSLYFGTDAAAVASATTASPQFVGKQTTTSYKASGLSNLRYYYWRVDETDGSGTTTKGNVWAFSPQHLAFPDAQGYGRFARGGRCGKVVHVTNLNDSGTGSLRAAVENDIGPRTIIFDVGGLITLQSRLTLASNYTTVAGQTAPGKGILIRSAPFGLSGANDTVVRFMRVRVGFTGTTYDGTGMQGCDASIMDHVSVGWSIDEAFSSRNAKNITLQRTMIAEALNDANHTNSAGQVNDAHGFAATISGNTGSYHHILSAHNAGRNFSMGAAIDGSGNFISQLDLFNNVIYNFQTRATDGQAHYVNFVNNYYKDGPATAINFTFNMQLENFGTGTLQCYYAGDILQNTNGTFACDGTDNTCGRIFSLSNGNPAPTWNIFPTSGPFFPSYATIQSAKDAYKDVLSDVGATMPLLDDHDTRIVKETLNGTFTYKGSITGLPGIIDRETDAGGFESYPTSTRAAGFDTDADGLPDWYETAIGTNLHSAAGDFSDPNADPDGDGYTNLEDYLTWLATPNATVKAASSTTFNLTNLFAGYTKSPTYTTGASSCLTTSVKSSTLTVTPKSACGIVYLPVTVTDGDKDTMTRLVAVYASP